MTAVAAILPPDPKADEEFDLIAHWNKLSAEQRAGDVGALKYERAIGVAIARVSDKAIRNALIAHSYTLVGEH